MKAACLNQKKVRYDMSMTRRWVFASSSKLSFSPSMAPSYNPQQQQDELLFLKDRHFELHGEIMMFVLVAMFSLFILFLVVLPCLRVRHLSNHEPDSVAQTKCPLPWLKTRRRNIDEITPEVSLQGETEADSKFPL
ncbi:hypothetical protein SO802_017918 [Lithocarpus litseifolius]|uniref:Transmembrane protein n=1 Tax=Lithocarpus litseifolius TaxID=425828 RepID=A0AAW2CJA9_9ROSI